MSGASSGAPNMILRVSWIILIQRDQEGLQEGKHPGWDEEEGLGYGVRPLIQPGAAGWWEKEFQGFQGSQLQHSMDFWGLCQHLEKKDLHAQRMLQPSALDKENFGDERKQQGWRRWVPPSPLPN